MIIGNGMVAMNFAQYKDRNDIIIFASGISNSKIKLESEFNRERDLLVQVLNENRNKKFVYFSTFNLYDPKEKNSPYCLHKLKMENTIRQNAIKYNIFRLGHVAGSSAKQYTILSFLYNAINEGTQFKLWKNASRNIIDIQDVSKICSYIIDNDLFPNQIINVCNTFNTTILEIVTIIETILSKKGIYILLEEGGCPSVNNDEIQSIINILNINFDKNYTQRVISKYYSNLQ